jgi:ParB family chromosome partitioning protein
VVAATRRSGLGKGLSALIPAEVVPTADAGVPGAAVRLIDLPVGDLTPNPHQPRRAFDEEALASLTASVRELGVLQPVLVRPGDDGRYVLIAGERRWRAARRAGLPSVPALVKSLDDTASLEQAVVENLHREDLNALEEAAAYQQLIEEFGLTHEQVSARVGKSRAAVTNALRLFQLPPAVQKLVADGQLTAGHAKALLGTPDRAFLEGLARRVVTEGLTVREVEDTVRARNDLAARTSGEPGASPVPRRRRNDTRDPGLLELEELLASFLETRVSIQAGAGKGKLVVEFADLEDLERIYRRIATGPADPDGPIG